MESKNLPQETVEDEEHIAKMYAVIQDIHPERRKWLAAELSRRLHR